MPLYLEDVEVGREWSSVGRTVTEADIANFAGVSGDFNLLHTNAIWVRENTPFRGPIAHGLLVLSMSSGLRTPGLDDLAIVAFVEVSRKMIAPVYPGDTVRARYTAAEARPSKSRPQLGVVRLDVDVRNQDDEVVQSGVDVVMVQAGGSG
jgi:3-hydroxybutyryl-CoA dehydratase